MGAGLPTWSLESLEKAAVEPPLPLVLSLPLALTTTRPKSAATAPACWPLTARLLRGAGGGTGSRGHSSVRCRERETAGCSSEEAAPPAERLPPTSFRLLGSSWTSGASEAESGRAGGELLGRTASASLLTPETWNLIGATQQKHHNKDAQLENHRQWCNQH